MPIIISTNIASLEAQKNIAGTQEKLRLSFQRLSSGFRVNTASDDASGLAISESLQMQIRGHAVAERNTNNGISMAQVADGALGQITSIIARMRDLAVQASNGDLNSTDRGYINTEFGQLRSEIDRIAAATKFNQIGLLNSGTYNIAMQVGTGTNTYDSINVQVGGVSVTALNLSGALADGATNTNAQNAITWLDTAIGSVNTTRATFGATMNRLQMAVAHTQSMRTNLSAANSRIRDVDVAEETAQLARSQVLAQAGASVLAQANQAPQLALSLLR